MWKVRVLGGCHWLQNCHYDVDRANRTALTEKDKKWLKSRGYRYDCEDFSCVHGDFIDPKDWGYIIESRDARYNFQAVDAAMTFCGHTHHACIWEKTSDGDLDSRFDHSLDALPQRPESVTVAMRKGYRYIVNCGSVGYPRNDLCSTCAIYNTDTRRISIRRN